MNFEIDDLKLAVLSRSNLNDALSENLGISKAQAEALVNGFFELIADRLAVGEEVKLVNFGNFRVLSKRARTGRNPKTGTSAPIESRHSVVFNAGPKLRKKMRISHDSDQRQAFKTIGLPVDVCGDRPDIKCSPQTAGSHNPSSCPRHPIDSDGIPPVRDLGVDSEAHPRRGHLSLDFQPHSPSVRQKDEEKLTATGNFQAKTPKSDRLPELHECDVMPNGENAPIPLAALLPFQLAPAPSRDPASG
jgi:integration host factor subunit alpha